MPFNKEEIIAQPPQAEDIIFERIPTSQYRALLDRIVELKGVLIAIQEFCYNQRREWIESGKPPEAPPMVLSTPIITVIKEHLNK